MAFSSFYKFSISVINGVDHSSQVSEYLSVYAILMFLGDLFVDSASYVLFKVYVVGPTLF